MFFRIGERYYQNVASLFLTLGAISNLKLQIFQGVRHEIIDGQPIRYIVNPQEKDPLKQNILSFLEDGLTHFWKKRTFK